MRTPTTRDLELMERNTRRPIPLVVLTTYTDRDAKTVDEVFYLSDRAALYDYGNTGTVNQFWPFLLGLSDYEAEMTHFPQPALPTIEEMQVRLANREVEPGGNRLSEYLRGFALRFATIEIAELDLDREPDYCDFRSLNGDEHRVWYRGELVGIGDVSSREFTLTFETVLPRIPRSIISDATTADLRDLGQTKHLVYGAAKRVPLHATTAAARTTLAEAITAAYTGTVKVTDTTGFSNGTASIGGEFVSFTVASGTTINITARGVTVSGVPSVAAGHLQGTAVFEVLSAAEWTAAGHVVDAISAVYAVNPYNNELFLLTSGTHYTGTVNDGGVATVEITNAQLAALLQAATESAAVSTQANSAITQPVVSHPVRSQLTDQHPISGSANLIDDNTSTGDSIAPAGNTGNVTFTDLGTIVEQRVYFHLDGVASDMSLYTGAGTYIGTVTSSSSGWYSFPTAIDTHTFYVRNDGASSRGVNEFLRTMTYDVDSPDLTTDVDFADSAIVAAEVGYAIDLLADLRGYEASGTDYSVSAGTMLAHPSDVIRHYIAALCGEGHSAIEDASFDAAVTNLGSGGAFACAIDLIEDTDEAILGRLAYEARSNLVPVQGATSQQWRLLQAQTTYDFPAATLPTITEGEWTYDSVIGDQISTRFKAVYDRDPFLGDGIDAYRGIVRIDVDQNDVSVPSTGDLTAAEDAFGRRELRPLELRCIADLATAEDWLGYLANETIRAPRTWIGKRLPWWDTYTLELGDIVNIAPDWIGSPIKGRVVSFKKSFVTGLVELGIVEVE